MNHLETQPIRDPRQNIYVIGGRCAVGATNATRIVTGKVVEECTFLEEPEERVIAVVIVTGNGLLTHTKGERSSRTDSTQIIDGVSSILKFGPIKKSA